jgi:hypothetical protein
MAIAAAIASIGVVAESLFHRFTIVNSTAMIGERPFNELTKSAIDIQQAQSISLLNLGMLVLTALWGLMIAGHNEARVTLKDKPELIMFASGTVLLIAALFWHNLYLESVSSAYAAAGSTCSGEGSMCIADIFDPRVHHQLEYQRLFVVFGVMVGLATLLSAHRFKE